MFTQSWAWSQRSPSWICETLRPRVRHSAARLGGESETSTLSMSKAMEGDFASRPSRSSDRSRTVSSSVSVVGRSRSDGGPMPSGNNGSESHRSRSGEWSRRDRGHGSERSHKSSRFHHSTRHRESGERARPKSSSGGSSSRSKQADVMDVRMSTSTHHQHHHNPCPLHLGYGLVVPRLKLRRQRLPAGLPDPVTRRRSFHPASLWWEDPGRTAAQCLPGPTDLNAIDYAVVFGADEVHGSERLQNSPRSGHTPRHRRSGEQTRPKSLGGFSSRARHADPTSSLEVIDGSWVRSGSQLHDRCESVDSVMSGLSYVSRREVQLSPVAPQQTEKRTITVIPLPPRPADDGPASDGLAGDDLASDSPADDGPAYDGSAGDGSSRLVSFGWPSSCDRSDGLCTTQQLLLTQHSIRRFQLSTPIASSLQLLCRDALLKNFGFQPQVLSTARTAPFEGSRVLDPEPKVLQNTLRTIRQVDWMAGSSVTFAQRHRDSKSSRKAISSRRLRQGHQSSIVWDLLLPPRPREQWHRSRPFALALAGESATDPILTVWQVFCGFLNQTTLTGPRWGPGRLCPTLAESAGQLPGHRHCRGWGGQCIPATTSAHPSVRQLSDQKQPSGPPASPRCLAAEGIHRAGHQHDFPRVLQPVVPGPKEDRRSAACNPLSTATW